MISETLRIDLPYLVKMYNLLTADFPAYIFLNLVLLFMLHNLFSLGTIAATKAPCSIGDCKFQRSVVRALQGDCAILLRNV